MRDLVVISLEVWDEVWRRNQHLIAGLLRTGRVDRVLFVEPAVDVVHDLRSRRRPERTGLRQVRLPESDIELWVFRPRKVLPRRIDSRGDRRRASDVVANARRLGFSDPVLWVNDPGGVEVLEQSGWAALYDITDDWLVAERPEIQLDRLRRQESELLARCHEVVVCSSALQGIKSTERDVVLIPNAVDLEPYRTLQPRPSDLPLGPVALYLGTVHRDRIDVELCIETARQLAGSGAGSESASLVLVGPAPLSNDDLEELRRARVQVLGPRRSHDVPAYLQHADVLLVPHVLTQFTASLDPIKAYEYEAAGRPVVATRVPGFVNSENPRVHAVEAAQFPQAVAAACARAQPWTLDIPIGMPTWLDRVEQMAAVIGRVRGDQV